MEKFKTIAKALLLIVVLAAGTVWYFNYTKKYPSTDDAYVNANLVNVAPKVSGYVTEVLVQNNQVVKKGDVLFRIETTDYTVQLAQEQQSLQYAIQQANNAKMQINIATADLASSKANLDNLYKQVLRYTQMSKQNAASTEQLQSYQTQYTQARAEYEQKQNSVAQAKIQLEAESAQVQKSMAGVQDAQNHIGYTDVISPVNGYVSNMNLTEGQYVSAGQQIFGLVDNTNWWIDANFKETDLERVKAGQPVKVKLDMYSNAHYTGTVTSLSYASGGTFSLLPAQNATGNWVKVTQRFTIRIKVQNNPQFPLRVGLSADVEVDTTK